MKYEINYSINKFEEIFPDGNPTRICKYIDKDGNVVEKEDITKELFKQEVKIDDDTLTNVVSFGRFGFNETSLDNMTARQFIEEVLIPHTKRMNATIKRNYSEK